MGLASLLTFEEQSLVVEECCVVADAAFVAAEAVGYESAVVVLVKRSVHAGVRQQALDDAEGDVTWCLSGGEIGIDVGDADVEC